MCLIGFPQIDPTTSHSKVLFQAITAKDWADVLQNSVQLWGYQAWCKICNKGVMIAADTKLSLDEIHVIGFI